MKVIEKKSYCEMESEKMNSQNLARSQFLPINSNNTVLNGISKLRTQYKTELFELTEKILEI